MNQAMASVLDFHDKVCATYMVTGVKGLQFHLGESEEGAQLLRLLHESLHKFLPIDFVAGQFNSELVNPELIVIAGPSHPSAPTHPKTPELSEDVIDTIDGVPIPRHTPTPHRSTMMMSSNTPKQTRLERVRSGLGVVTDLTTTGCR